MHPASDMNHARTASLEKAPLALALALALASTACTRRDPTCAETTTTSGELAPRTSVGTPVPVAPAPVLAVQADSAAPLARPVSEDDLGVREAPPADWVPDAGRLTVIDSHDLWRNLGLPPPSGAVAADAGAAPPR